MDPSAIPPLPSFDPRGPAPKLLATTIAASPAPSPEPEPSLVPSFLERTLATLCHVLPIGIADTVLSYCDCARPLEPDLECSCVNLVSQSPLLASWRTEGNALFLTDTQVAFTNIRTKDRHHGVGIVDLPSRRLVHVLQGHYEKITAACSFAGQFVTGTENGCVRLWSLQTEFGSDLLYLRDEVSALCELGADGPARRLVALTASGDVAVFPCPADRSPLIERVFEDRFPFLPHLKHTVIKRGLLPINADLVLAYVLISQRVPENEQPFLAVAVIDTASVSRVNFASTRLGVPGVCTARLYSMVGDDGSFQLACFVSQSSPRVRIVFVDLVQLLLHFDGRSPDPRPFLSVSTLDHSAAADGSVRSILPAMMDREFGRVVTAFRDSDGRSGMAVWDARSGLCLQRIEPRMGVDMLRISPSSNRLLIVGKACLSGELTVLKVG